MLPPSHVAYTAAVCDLLSKKIPELKDLDYRLLALAAMGPDILDKPLALLYFYRKYKAAVLFAHTLLVHLVVLGYTLWKQPRGWPYLLAFNGHALLDRLWFFPNTWYWPFLGWRFTVWHNNQAELGNAYWHAFTRRLDLLVWEAGGLLAAAWFIRRHRLYNLKRLRRMLRTGKVVD